MAVFPYLVVSPNTVLSAVGLVCGPRGPVSALDRGVAARIKVEVIMSAHDEAPRIGLALASLKEQTLRPHRVTVVDDGSRDETASVVRAFAQANDFPIDLVTHPAAIGKTPGLKRRTRASDADVIFVFDADTVLVSPGYIEDCVLELCRTPGIASVCGRVLPIRESDRRHVKASPSYRLLQDHYGRPLPDDARPWYRRLAEAVTNFYRDVVYRFSQHFLYRGQQNLFGSIMNPVGCGVAYRRDTLIEIFDHYEPGLGDNLTTSEDIFVGFAFVAAGYRNVQIPHALMRTQEPEIHRLPKQLRLWSSAWLQSAYYFPKLVGSLFWAPHRRARRQREAAHAGAVVDPYQEAFGLEVMERYGRPAGWVAGLAIFEKVSLPIALGAMLALRSWHTLAVTVVAEVLTFTLLLAAFAQGRRLEYVAKGLLVTPLRYGSLVFDLVVLLTFLRDLVTRNRNWRK
jgi:glycosyltransferase involved in cell wall biosynthesis